MLSPLSSGHNICAACADKHVLCAVFVYLGVMFGLTSGTGASEADIEKQRRISLSVFFVTALLTVVALYIIYMRARKLYPQILAERAERGFERGEGSSAGGHDGGGGGDPLRKEELANIIVHDDPSTDPRRQESYDSVASESASQREYEHARLANGYALPPAQPWPGSGAEGKAHPYSLQPRNGGTPPRSPKPSLEYSAADTSDLGQRHMHGGTALTDGEGGDAWRAVEDRERLEHQRRPFAEQSHPYGETNAAASTGSFAEVPLTAGGDSHGGARYH